MITRWTLRIQPLSPEHRIKYDLFAITPVFNNRDKYDQENSRGNHVGNWAVCLSLGSAQLADRKSPNFPIPHGKYSAGRSGLTPNLRYTWIRELSDWILRLQLWSVRSPTGTGHVQDNYFAAGRFFAGTCGI